jgi:hypothetical protein
MKGSTFFNLMVLCLTISACGGGGGNSSNNDSSTDNNESANGVWRGYTTSNFGQSSFTQGIFYNGDFVVINDDFQEFYSGTYSTSSNNFTSSNTKGYYWNGPYIGVGSINGFLSSKGKMSLIFSSDTGVTGSIDLDYEPTITNSNITYSDLSGTWLGASESEDLSYAIVVDGQGNFAAEASDGCQIFGNAIIPNNNLSIFEIALSISGINCTVNGSYKGLGFLYEEEIYMAYSNDIYGFAYDATKIGQ